MMVLISSTQFSTLSEISSGMVNNRCKAARLVKTQGAQWLDRIACSSVSLSAEKEWKQQEDPPVTLAGDQWLPREYQAPMGFCEVMNI